MENNHPPSDVPQLVRADERVLEAACSLCGQGFQLTEPVYQCPFCQGYHHTACWETHRQCVPTSEGSRVMEQAAAPTPAAAAVAAARAELICPRCRLINPPDALRCDCGHPFQAGASFSAPAYPPEVTANLPSLHWGVVLLLTFLTCGIFPAIWGVRQGYWAKSADSSSHALLFYVLYWGVLIVILVLEANPDIATVGTVLRLAGAVCFQAGNFSLKGTMEDKLSIVMSGVLTFFFGPIYHQYKLNEFQKYGGTKESSLSILTS